MKEKLETRIIKYLDDPDEYERVLRRNLSSRRHTKQSLINFAVHIVIEAELLSIELNQMKTQARAEMAGIPFAALSLPNMNLDDAVQVLREHFKNEQAAELLARAKKASLKSTGKQGGEAKRKNDPYRKDLAIRSLRDHWYEWQRHPEPRTVYRTQKDFARVALGKIPKDKGGNPVVAESTLLKKLIPIWNREKEGKSSAAQTRKKK